MLRKNIVIWLATFLLLAFLGSVMLLGCTDPEEKKDEKRDGAYGGVLKITRGQDIFSLDPILSNVLVDVGPLSLIYDSLIDSDESFTLPQPGLAREWEYLNETTLRLYLVEGVSFHDGTPFNADVVKFNIERVNSADSFWKYLKSIEEVVVVDEFTVELKLSTPDCTLLMALSTQAGMMVSPAAVEKYGDLHSNPVGTGPYKFLSFEPLSELRVVKNEDYWQKGLPYLDEVHFIIMQEAAMRIMTLESGEVNASVAVTPAGVAQLKDHPDIVLSDKSQDYWTVAMNTATYPLDNAKLRQAINLGLNRQAAVQAGFSFEAPSQVFPAGHWAHNPNLNVPPYDVARARQLVEEAGLEGVTVTLSCAAGPLVLDIAEMIKAMLEQINIKVELNPLEATAARTQFVTGRTELYLVPYVGASPHPITTYEAIYSANGMFNPSKWSNPEIEDLLSKAKASLTFEEEQEYIHEIARILNEGDDPGPIATPIAFNLPVAAHRSNVKDISFNFAPHRIDFRFAWIEE